MEDKFVYKPGGEFTGAVEIAAPSEYQRMCLLDDANFKTSDDGLVESQENIKALRHTYEAMAEYVLKVTLKHKSGKSFKSWDAMMKSPLCNKVCSEVYSYVLFGKKLGEG
jgi:hypothetical protein